MSDTNDHAEQVNAHKPSEIIGTVKAWLTKLNEHKREMDLLAVGIEANIIIANKHG